MKELFVIVALSMGVLGIVRCFLPAAVRHVLGKREFAAASLLPAIATISPNYPIFMISVIGFISLVPASPQQRISLGIFSLPLLPEFSLIVRAPDPVNQLVQIDYTVILFLGLLPLAITLGRKARGRYGAWDAYVMLLAAVLVFMAGRGTAGTNILRLVVQYILMIGLPYYVLSRGMSVAKRPVELLMPLIFSAAVIGVIATFESFRGWLLYASMDFGQDPAVLSGYAKQRAGFLRGQASFPESTSLSLFLALFVVFTYAIRREFAGRGGYVPVMLLIVCGTLFTFARVGLLVIVVGFLALLLFERRYVASMAIVSTGPLIWGALRVVGKAMPAIGATLGLSADAAGSIDYRSNLSARIISIVRENALLGVSWADASVLLEDMRQGEGIIDLVNSHLAITLQSGLIGLSIFMLPSIVAIQHLKALNTSPDHGGRALAGGVFAAMISLHAGLFTTSLLARNMLWLTLLLAIVAGLSSNKTFGRERNSERRNLMGATKKRVSR